MEVKMRVWLQAGCSQLVHMFKKALFAAKARLIFFEHANNLQTVTRLGVGRFRSTLAAPKSVWVLVNMPTLYAWGRKKKIIYLFFLKR